MVGNRKERNGRAWTLFLQFHRISLSRRHDGRQMFLAGNKVRRRQVTYWTDRWKSYMVPNRGIYPDKYYNLFFSKFLFSNGPFSSSQLSGNRTFFLNWCESVGKTSVKENRQPLTLRHKMCILANSISTILFSFYRGRKEKLVKSLPFTSCLVPSVTFLHVFEGLV